MNKPLRPSSVGAPSANYELAVLSSLASDGTDRLLHTSGIGPVDADGSVPEAMARQASVVWSTLGALLAEADMAPPDVVQVCTYVVVPSPGEEDLSQRLSVAMAARDQALGRHRCASVLVPVPALATATWKMEVSLVAVGRTSR